MSKLTAKFSPAVVEGKKPEAVAYRVWDTVVPSLFLRVQPSGVKSWNVQWNRNTSRALGKWPGVTVDAARTKARAALVETDTHGAPIAVIEANKPAAQKPITLGQFIREHYTPWAQANQKAAEATLAALEAVFGEMYKRELRSVSAFDVERIKSNRLKAKRKPGTVNRDLDRIRGVFSRAVEWGFVDAHPLKAVKRAKGEDHSRVRYLTDDEETALRDALEARDQTAREARQRTVAGGRAQHAQLAPYAADEYPDNLTPLVLVALNTGLRRGELFGLSWADVNLQSRLLTVQAGNAKSRKARHVPLNEEAHAVLTRCRKHGLKSGLVFPGAYGERMTNVNKSWDGIVTAAGLVDFRFHDLRHTFASKLVMAGVDLNTVRELLGHSDIAMTLRYAHLAPAKLADAVALIGAKIPAKAGKRRAG